MSNCSKWEKYYKETPLDKIPWQRTQADYFIKVIDTKKIKPGLALDLGCGTGKKSIYLAKKGFKVTSIDISKTAIEHAKKNAKKDKVKVKFITADAADLSFLKNKKFDFVLDWANFHGIAKNKRKKYVNGIIKHTKKNGIFLLRCFGKDRTNKEKVIRPMGSIWLSSKEDIGNLFGKNFKILEINISKPFEGNPPSKLFYEFLMRKI